MKFIFGTLTNWLVAFVSAILLVFNVSDINVKQNKIDLKDYELTFSDEFNGDKLNKELWRAHNSEGRRRGGYWTLEQVSVKNGNLIINTQYKEDGKFGSGWYTGAISTQGKFEQTYGYYECRCILPQGYGIWSAFWLTNPNVTKLTTGKAVKGAEIDVFESPFWHLGEGRRNKVTSNIHFNGYDLQTRYKNVAITRLANNPYENFNTYGMLWTPDEYIFYINGYEVARSHYGGVSQEQEYMILSCEIEGDQAKPTYGWSGKVERNDRDTFNAEFVVDYVRAYKAK